MDYYKSQYDVTVTDLEQPLLVHRPRPTRDPNPGRKVALFLNWIKINEIHLILITATRSCLLDS